MGQLENIEAIEKELWRAAGTLRASSNYVSSECSLIQVTDQKAHDGGEFFASVSPVSSIAKLRQARALLRPGLLNGEVAAGRGNRGS